MDHNSKADIFRVGNLSINQISTKVSLVDLFRKHFKLIIVTSIVKVVINPQGVHSQRI